MDTPSNEAWPLNRKLRRAKARLEKQQRKVENEALRRGGYFATANGYRFADLQERAYGRLRDKLISCGNRLSEDHETALYGMIGAMNRMAQGRLQGRWAFGLPTGMGKTSSIVAFVSALHELGLDHVSVAVAASKVEALAELKREMIAAGVPEDRIGLIHSYRHDPAKIGEDGTLLEDGYASEPSTEGPPRQIMLVSHARFRDAGKLKEFATYQGKPRDVLIYDESLMVSDSVGIPVRELKAALGYLKGYYDGAEKQKAVIDYLSRCLEIITAALEEAKASREAVMVDLPSLTDETIARYRAALGRRLVMDSAHNLLDICREPIRVIPTAQGGAVSYQIKVPEELKNVIILDASHPIRRLIHADKTIKDAEKELPEFRNARIKLSQIKRFDDVKIYQRFSGGGRETMNRAFTAKRESRAITKEIGDVILRVPEDEAVLIFVYKSRHTDNTNYRDILLRDLEARGIDINATIDVRGKRLPRINVATWGMETATNAYAHCSHVILAGVMQRSLVDLASAYLGQMDNIQADFTDDEIRDIWRSEVAHTAYQALSRGSCRVVENGQAKPMTAYIIHRDDTLQDELASVMPGAEWRVWDWTEETEGYKGNISETANRIEAVLRELPPEIEKLSTQKLKKLANLREVPKRTFSYGLQRALNRLPRWVLEGRSVVRYDPSKDFSEEDL